MSELEFDYEKEYVKFVIRNDLWDKNNNRLKKKVYTVLGIRNQKYDETNPHGGYYGGQHYVEFTTKPPKPVKLTHCRSCFKELTGKKEQYCNRTCKQNGKELRKKFIELEKSNPKIQAIFSKEDKEFEKPEWIDVIGIFENNGKFKEETNVITNKHHRGRQSRKPKNQPIDFSKGKDY